uniref:Gag-Pol polyprotein n=1 Tax=Tanacetum cinerariifolium TaxID=118510 RepID=A0A699HEY9_TANCI|nr:hypothetical protein [Tanacetum cinerariifolium]
MHNYIMAAGLRDRPPILATGRYAQWQSRQPAIDESPEVPERIIVETFSISLLKKAYYDAEKEAIHILLNRIGDEIYSTIDACKIAHDMWIAIESSQDGESIESYYSRFYKMINEMLRNQLEVATMQYQKEVNEIRAEKIAKNANPLALVVVAQQYPNTYYQATKPHCSYVPPAKTSPSTRSHAITRHKGKEIAKPILPLSQLLKKIVI